ncbi:MAG: TIM barrel protein [Gemmatimonadetes bacterium]|nr:TIM barrel protein [Gemmatimonadota bacterium]
MPESAPIRFSTSVSLMFRELPILERFEAARRAGFEAVEIQVIEEGNPAEMAQAARAAGIDVLLLNVSLGDFRTGGPALSGVPGRETAFRQALAQALDAAATLGARFLHLGPSRIGESTREACLDTYRSNLRFAAERAAGYPVEPVIEPLNTVETPDILLASLEQAAGLIGEVGGGIGIQYDLYHATLNRQDLIETYRRHRALIRHVQFADAPGRHEPGTGTVDFGAAFRGLIREGYRGFAGAEYFPSRATGDTLGWLPSLRELVAS